MSNHIKSHREGLLHHALEFNLSNSSLIEECLGFRELTPYYFTFFWFQYITNWANQCQKCCWIAPPGVNISPYFLHWCRERFWIFEFLGKGFWGAMKFYRENQWNIVWKQSGIDNLKWKNVKIVSQAFGT